MASSCKSSVTQALFLTLLDSNIEDLRQASSSEVEMMVSFPAGLIIQVSCCVGLSLLGVWATRHGDQPL